MTQENILHPGSIEGSVEKALEHVRAAEHDLVKAQGEEHRAEKELERAVEELEHAEHDKTEWVIVNGRRKEVHVRRLSYEDVVLLAFPISPAGEALQFTVQYSKGPEYKPSGTLVEGQSVKVKEGMEFDVTPTNRS